MAQVFKQINNLGRLSRWWAPIGDKQKYDLVGDDGEKFIRIQCKYTSQKTDYNVPIVTLRVMGGNRSYNTAKKYEKGDFDILFVLTSDGKEFVVPFNEIESTSSCHLGKKFEKYNIN